MNLTQAATILIEEAEKASKGNTDAHWVNLVQELSDMCEQQDTRTHIAFLGTALLAKATDLKVDVFAIKANKSPGAYSARTLAHNVLVPNAAKLGINLGVTGREPLNNQPYFRMERLDDGTRVHVNAKPIVDRLKSVVAELAKIDDPAHARKALRSFIFIRKQYQPKYISVVEGYMVTKQQLFELIKKFVGEDSEGGKRAQAVSAGLLDVFAGTERVFSGRINDPSRHFPGDIAVRSLNGEVWEKVFEVRDKPISLSDVFLFCQRCMDSKIRQAAIIAVASNQHPLAQVEIDTWLTKYGMGLELFYNWQLLLEQILFWSPTSAPLGAPKAIPLIQARLIKTETSEAGVTRWLELASPYRQSS